MSTPISKAFTRNISPTDDKVSKCCGSTNFLRSVSSGNALFICDSRQCENSGKPTDLVIPEGKKATIYKIRPLTPEEHGRLMDEAPKISFEEGKETFRPHDMVKLWCKAGLVGWENFDTPFTVESADLLGLGNRSMITDAAFNEIPYNDTLDIAWAVRNFNRITEAEAKN